MHNNTTTNSRVSVHRTLKAYVGGAFIRSESGRTYRVETGTGYAEVADMSRKDTRDAVRYAREAAVKWSASSAYLRGQILHRLGEMLENAPEIDDLAERLGLTPGHLPAADLAVHYAGFCDKIGQILGTTNAVHGHSSHTEPLGIGPVAVYLPDDAGVLDIVEALVSSLAAGNSVLLVAAGRCGALACTIAERLAVSDLPAGLAQILPTSRDEALVVLAGATDIRALDATRHRRRADLEVLAAESVTRLRTTDSNDRPGAHGTLARIRWQIEYRTVVAATGR